MSNDSRYNVVTLELLLKMYYLPCVHLTSPALKNSYSTLISSELVKGDFYANSTEHASLTELGRKFVNRMQAIDVEIL